MSLKGTSLVGHDAVCLSSHPRLLWCLRPENHPEAWGKSVKPHMLCKQSQRMEDMRVLKMECDLSGQSWKLLDFCVKETVRKTGVLNE